MNPYTHFHLKLSMYLAGGSQVRYRAEGEVSVTGEETASGTVRKTTIYALSLDFYTLNYSRCILKPTAMKLQLLFTGWFETKT